MARKNLSDTIHGDRSLVRQYHGAKDYFPDDYGYGGGHSSVDWGAHSSSGDSWARCYEKHPALKLPGTELVIYGGSCVSPIVKDADIYIGFDASMRFTERNWPWKKGAEVLFKITDMCAPDKPEEFKKLIVWTKKQLEAGLKVHAGCIGGHGRTGTFLAALVSEFGEKDAIAYVREHYCKKAVESSSQVKFLEEHFGVTPHQGYKSSSSSASSYKSTTKSSGKGPSKASSKGSKSSAPLPVAISAVERFVPVKGNGCLWG